MFVFFIYFIYCIWTVSGFCRWITDCFWFTFDMKYTTCCMTISMSFFLLSFVRKWLFFWSLPYPPCPLLNWTWMKAVTSISSTFCKRHLLRLDCGLSIYLHCRPLKWLSFHLKKASRFYPLFFFVFPCQKDMLGFFPFVASLHPFSIKIHPWKRTCKNTTIWRCINYWTWWFSPC